VRKDERSYEKGSLMEEQMRKHVVGVAAVLRDLSRAKKPESRERWSSRYSVRNEEEKIRRCAGVM